jgi:hypothetical protein
MTRSSVTTAAEILGAILIVAAVWIIWMPAGLALAGAFFMLFGWAAGR